MSILQTEVLPIEYDKKTEKKAIKTKKWLNTNPPFFKAFLPKADKISHIDPKSTIYIGPRESILTHLDGISASEALSILKENTSLNQNDQMIILMYLWNKRINGQYTCSDIDSRIIEKIAATIYFCDKKDYEGYHTYLLEQESTSQEKIFEWLKEKNRFPLLNYLESEQLKILKKYYFHSNKEEQYQELLEMHKFSLLETINEESYTEEQIINYPVSKEKSLLLVKEFLTEINPTLTWLKEFYNLEKSDKLIEDVNDKRVKSKKTKSLTWQLFYTEESGWCLYTPWRNTLEDSISLLHEFCHYISCKDEISYQKTIYQLSEFPSLFFETLMCEFLKKKGYPIKEVDKYLINRKIDISGYGLDIENYLKDFETMMTGEKINLDSRLSFAKTLEDEYKYFDSTFSLEESYQKPLIDIIKDDVDDDIECLLLMPDIFLETYPYIIGKRYSDIMISKMKEDSSIIQKMISITERICDIDKKEIEQELGLNSPIKKQKVYKTKH